MKTTPETIPSGWTLIETGGGATALHRAIEDSVMEWEIVQSDAPTAPDNADEACRLIVYMMGDVLLEWHCENLAEALRIARGRTAS